MPDGIAGTVESNGFTITSNTETSEAMTAALTPPETAVEAAGPDDATSSEEAKAPAQAAEKPAGKPRNDPQARVEAATAKEAQAKREREETLRENASLKARLEALERRQPDVPRGTSAVEPAAEKPKEQPDHLRYKALPGYPKLGDFTGEDAFEDWMVAKDLFIADQRFEERTARQQQETSQREQQASEAAHATAFAERLGKTAEERQVFIDSIDPRLANTPRITALRPGETATFGNYLVEQIYRSESPKELMLHFTAHPDDVQRLATLPPLQVMREIGKLEATLAPPAASPKTGTAEPPPRSKASPPIQPVKGSSQHASDEPPGDDASEEAHDAYWSKQRVRFRS